MKLVPVRTSLVSVITALVTLSVAVAAESKVPAERKVRGFSIGCILYTFNNFSAFEAIEKTAEAGGTVVELCAMAKLSKEEPNIPFNYNSPPAVLQKIKDKLAKHKLKAASYAIIPFPAAEAEARKVFEFAKSMGVRVIITEQPELIDMMEKLVKEFDIMIAFHNHPKQADAAYRMWDPNYVLSLVKNRDRRLGVCADTGHWVRSGLKPVECLRILKGRILCSHLKDLNEMAPGAHDVPYGTGVSDIPGILDELKAQNFNGNLSIEYEYHWDTSLPEVSQCIGFVRGYGAARKW